MTVPRLQLFVGGRWEEGAGAPITSHNPWDWSEIGTLRGASEQDGERAIAHAEAAQPAWGAALPTERAAVLRRIGDGIEANADRISALQTMDTGKTRAETRALALSAAGTFRYFAALAETAEDAITPRRGPATTFSVHEPIGVTAAITPWNSPIASDAQKVAPALAAGNAVLLKPASWAPLTALLLAEIANEAGLPAGLLSVLPGAGREIGSLLVNHPAIGRVAFTGGTSTGRQLAAQAAAKLMPVSLELGGKSPVAVFADADMDRAIAGVLFGIFSSSGQSCIAGSRLFVQAKIYEAFRDRLVVATKKLVVGDPNAPATRVGPLIHPDHHADVTAHLERARADGGRVLCGGPGDGRLFYPTIVEGLDNNAALCREEVFGPILSLLPFDDEADLIAKGNDNEYGLAAGIWTRDFDRAWRVAGAWQAGTIWINTYKQFSASTPFGADGASGQGREKGREGLRVWQRQKGIYADLTGATIPWGVA
ncbi:aldehyde dehydrogenase family protein [Thalassococcus sp. S3]|uniref:aldehyde dehydrogenase family protein n=1 Tax=Thalassococcus sp. S3 TaxID=2017482 RepID=UPI00102407A2|nr:aldehyde dehydrogenase family protein [Thalassococcus sp. S3]QBF33434.1 aldehyde dehydrogenase [Thalassococcus sp. S3]